MSRWFRQATLAVMGLTAFAWEMPAHADGIDTPPLHIAEASDTNRVRAGAILYKTYCAQCHGRNLQGQPLWHLQDQYLHRRAPAHDDSGHTWQHADEAIFQIIRTGRSPQTSIDQPGTMPAFGALMSDRQIIDVMAFIKARWSLGIQVSQASLNPGFAGMPERAGSVEWTLPLNCITTLPLQSR